MSLLRRLLHRWATAQAGDRPAGAGRPPQRRRAVVEALEPRLLYSADLHPAMWTGEALPSAQVRSVDLPPTLAAPADATPAESAVPARAQRVELLIVDSRVPDAQALLDDLRSRGGEAVRYELHRLDDRQDGLQQIATVLDGRRDIAALHLVSHGSEGALLLGRELVDGATLQAQADTLRAWSRALDGDADILLYGCDVAAGDTGRAFTETLAALTQADVAASDDLTGAAALGADWTLEQQTGRIDSLQATAAPAQWQGTLSLTPASSETRVNTVTGGTQLTTPFGGGNLAADAAGNYVIVWTDSRSGDNDIWARLYGADGTPAGAEFRVNSTTLGDQTDAAVAMTGDGRFVVTWTSSDGNLGGIYAQRFNADGTTAGSAFRVNTNTTGDQAWAKVAMDGSGNFVVAWSDYRTTSGDVYFQRYNATGTAQGGNVRANTFTTSAQDFPDVAMRADGAFIIVWESTGQDGDSRGVYAQRFAANGTAAGSEFRVNSTTANEQDTPKVGYAADGSFVISWDSVQDGDGDGTYVRRYAADGTARGGEIRVNTVTAGGQNFGDLAVRADGAFVVAWTSQNQDGSGVGVYAQRFDADGTAVDGERRLNTTTSGAQEQPSLSFVGDQIVAVWSGEGTGDNLGVFFQRLQVDAPLGFGAEENAGAPSGAVGTLVSALVGGTTDPQTGASWGIAIVGSDETHGTWYYSTDNGAAWTALGSVGTSNALLLASDASTRLYFAPTPGYTGPSPGALTLRTWDRSVGTAGSRVSTLPQTVRDEFTAVSFANNQGSTNWTAAWQELLDSGGAAGGDVFVTSGASVLPGNYLRIDTDAANEGLQRAVNLSGATSAVVSFDYARVVGSGTINFDVFNGSVWTTLQTFTFGSNDITAQSFSADISAYANANTQVRFIVGTVTVGSRLHVDNVQVSFDRDGIRSADQAVDVEVASTNLAPVIVSNGGQPTASVSVAETTTAVTTVAATDADADPLTYSIAGGADAARFTIDANSGALAFLVAPDFESPTDNGADNVYDVVVRAADGQGGTDDQALEVTVTDVASTLVVNTNADNNDAGIVNGNVAHTAEWLNARRGADSAVSLREAIIAANNTAGTNSISFSINAAQSIALTSNLDAIVGAVVIDGWSQPGYTGTPRVVIDGDQLAGIGLDLQDGSDGSVVRGLVLRDFSSHGIRVGSGADGITIVGNYLGALGTGGTDLGVNEAIAGAALQINGSGTTIGGNTAALRNVISGNLNSGIWITGGSANVVIGNYIGLAANGTTVIGNAWDGVFISGGSGHRIGGVANDEGNRIAGHGDDGIEVNTGTGHALLGNLIWSNASQGIDLGGNDSTPVPNDVGDVDTGANNLQNTPELTLARTNGSGSVSIVGSLDSAANGHYRVEFFASTTQSATGHGEAQRYLGFVNVPTNADGDAAGTFSFSASLAVGEYVTAIATATNASYDAFGDSSQFAANVAAISSVQATVTVTTTADTPDGDTRSIGTLIARPGADGLISLREALIAANNTANGSGGADRIHFDIGAALVSGVHTIAVTYDGADAGTVADDLPAVETNAVIIDGSTEPDFVDRPVVVLDGGDAVTDGLRLYAGSDGSTVRGLAIGNFLDNQIDIAISSGNTIVGNWLGLGGDGLSAAGSNYALNLWNANNNLIGSADLVDRNVISGSATSGIVINTDNGTSTGNRIRGNYIGTDATGNLAVGNAAQGVWVNASDNFIGGTAAGEGNVISGTASWVGVQLTPTASRTLVAGNLIGLNASGNAALGNAGGGLYIESADNTIGGSTPQARNIVSGNGGPGIVLNAATATGNVVLGNYIGTDVGGTLDLGNASDGVQISGGATDNLVGGSLAAERNLIAGNGRDGVRITDEASDDNIVRGNWIGVDATGTATLGNGGHGVHVLGGADGTLVGGGGANQGNWIAASSLGGIVVSGDATGTVIQGNRIGTDLAGTANWGTQQHGILLEGGASQTLVGGTGTDEGNLVAFAGQGGVSTSGIAVRGASSGDNALLGNRIYGSAGLAIDLQADGVTANDADDLDAGANDLQNFPQLGSATVNGSRITITGSLAGAANSPYRIEFFSDPSGDPSGYGEGAVYLGFAEVLTDATGQVVFSTTLYVGVTAGHRISATATASNPGYTSYGATSELSAHVTAVAGTAIANAVPPAQNVVEDTALVFSAANGNAVTVSDGSAADTRLRVTLTVTNGTLTLAQTTGLSIVGGADGSATMVLDGTESAINAAMDGMSYQPAADYAGSANLQIATATEAGLVGRYTFDDGSASDTSSGTVQNGSFAGNATTVVDGTRGTVLALDGAGDSVQIASTFGNPSSVSIGAWVNFTGVGRQELISIDDRVHLALDDTTSDNGVKGAVQTGASTWNGLSSDQFLSGTGWHHVMFVFDDAADRQTIYIDGVAVASETVTDSIYWTGATTTSIGRHPDGSFSLDGRVDDARIYDRALSAEEVAQLAADQSAVTDDVPITVQAANDAPVLSGVGGNLGYTENAGPVVLAGTATVGDIDSADFAGGRLVVGFAANGQAEDRLLVRDEGVGAGQIGVSGSTVRYGGTVIGSLAGGSDGTTPLVITLNAQADAAAVQALMRNVTYENVSDDPSTLVRSVEMSLEDGDGGTSNTVTRTVTPSSVNDAPSGTDSTIAAIEDSPYSFTLADFGFSDIDGDAPAAVWIDTLPGSGQLLLNGSGFAAGTAIAAADIAAGQLTYQPAANANGLALASFRFRVQDDGGTALGGIDTDASFNTLTLDVAAVADGPTGAPTITGSATEDQTLGVDTSTIADGDGLGSFAYQWLRDGVAVGGATGSTYALGDADVGTRLSVSVSYTDGNGAAEQLTSGQTAVVGNVNDTPTGLPAVTGTATEDQTLGVDTSGIADADGLGSFSYQWLRDGVTVGGATGSTYTLGDADVGTRLSVTVSYTDGNGTAEQRTSAQTAFVANVNDPTTGGPTVTGTATEDQTLGVDTSGIGDADGLGGFGYQWLRDGVAVAGANGATYTLGDADVGTRLSVTVSYTDANGTPEQVFSADSDAVANVNDAPTGAPTITGSATEDETLGVDTSAIADADGLGAFGYQWLRDGVAVSGATGATYTLGDADVGTRLSVTVSYTDGNGSAEQLTSAQTAIVDNVNDAPTGTPSITGTATEDQTLGVDTSAIADADGVGTFGYQWLRNGIAVSGATGATYTLGDADVGTRLSVTVSYTDGNGTAEQLTSAQTAVVANVNDTPTGAPTITGTATEDETLGVDTSGIADADGLGSFGYQWLRNGVAVSGATGATYTLGDADVGARLSVTVSYTDGNGSAEQLTSAQTAIVANVNDVPTGAPSITGTATEDQTLGVDTSAIADADGLGTLAYQWLRNGVAISGATGATHVVGDADVGARLSVTVSYTDARGNAEQLTSAQTPVVANVNDTPTGAPTISGTATEDETLGVDTSAIADADGLGSFGYQWLRNGVAVSGATGSTYTLGDADVGTRLSVTLSYTDANGTAEQLTSAQTSVVANLNDAPTGLPTITGTPQENQTLSVDTAGIADADGLGVFTFQWLRDGAVVSGATSSSYGLGDADVGTRLSVRVGWIDGGGSAESVTSAPTAVVANLNDAPTGAPSISGVPLEDRLLTAVTTGIGDADGLGSFSYQWLRDGQAIAGATGSTHLLGDADVGTRLSVSVRYIDGGGTVEQLTSGQTLPVTGLNDTPTGTPVVTGTPLEGRLLSADTSGVADADGLGPLSYQWLRDGAVIDGATGASHLLTGDDVGARLSVRIGYVDAQGTAESLTSAPSGLVAALNRPVVGTPVIAGSAVEDATLVADTSALSDADGLGSFAYQWLRDGVAIAGATGERYTLGDADVGARIGLQLVHVDAAGARDDLRAADTAPVANVDDPATGVPVLRGIAVEDGSLRADTDGIADADGLGSFGYQWLRDGVAIGGATGSTLVLGDADVGRRISVLVSYVDGGGTGTTLASAPSLPVAGLDDAPTGEPVIVGTPTEDRILTADVSSIADADGLGPLGYQWWRDGVAIAGATGASHVLGDADVGARLSVSVQWTDGQGTATTLTSAETEPVANVNDDPRGAPAVRGLPEPGQLLNADLGGLSDADGLGAVVYQWLRDGVAIDGATDARYTVAQADVGARLSVLVRYVDGGGSPEAVASAAVGPVGLAPADAPDDRPAPPSPAADPAAPAPVPERTPEATAPPASRAPTDTSREQPAAEGDAAGDAAPGSAEDPRGASLAAPAAPRTRPDTPGLPEANAWAPEPPSFELALVRTSLRADGDAEDPADREGLYDGLLIGRGRGGGLGELDEDGTGASRSSPARQLMEALTDPLTVSSASLTAGLLWWATRYGGLIATAMMGIPAWRQVDLMPVLARGLPDDDEFAADDDEDRPHTPDGSDGDDDAGLSEMLAIDDPTPAATAAALPDPPAAPVPTP